MLQLTAFIQSIATALRRARTAIMVVAVAYVLSVLVGMLMVHSGTSFALAYRDELVRTAQSGPILSQTEPLMRGLSDFGANLVAASADTLAGLGVVFPFPLIAYRGWVGGIVSVDGNHVSRLLDPMSAAYYLSVLLMQLTGFTLAAGAGLNVGLSLWRARLDYAGEKWLGIPKEALRDLLRIYALAIPIFLFASLWEFLSPWN
jgi:uncharacterized membrane protein SpoIIM required for sporulation